MKAFQVAFKFVLFLGLLNGEKESSMLPVSVGCAGRGCAGRVCAGVGCTGLGGQLVWGGTFTGGG